MRKITLMTLAGLVIFTITTFAQKSYVNPAAKYCEMLGYRYEISLTKSNGNIGMVHLPDGRIVNAWDFYKGKVATEYSYAAKMGFDIETETVKVDGYTIERAVCVRSEKGIEERILLLDLMKMNGDELVAEVKRTAPSIQDIASYDPNFTTAKSIPTAFDWRDNNGHAYIGDARDQGGCGSCYAFGAAAAAEGTYNFATGSYDGNVADFSESYIAWCLGSISPYSSHFGGCSGADYDYYELQALVDIGICDESYFPYSDANNQSCPSAATNAPKTKFENWYRVNSSDVDAIKTAIMTYGVVDAAVYVTTSFQSYSGGVWFDNNNSCSNGAYTTTNHAIALVGWGYDATYGDYWILRNSWGTSWGENGYMRIAVNSAAVDCAVCYMVYEDIALPPVAEFSASSTTVVNGSSVNFSDQSTNTPTSWSWSFSGGTPSTSTAQNPTVTYNTNGTYNVSLTVSNAEGSDSETKSGYITVVDATYCESAGNSVSDEWIGGVQVGTFSNTSGAAKYSDFTNLTANLVAGQTYNVTLTPTFAGTTYKEYWKIWIDLNGDADFDDANENVFDAGALSKTIVTGTLTIPSSTDAITTRMRVTMKYNGAPTPCENPFSYGEVEDYTVNITTAGNINPVANANGPYSGIEGTAILFSSAGSTDPDGTITSYAWSFGDGGTSTSANPSHTYSNPGTYTATLTVTDNQDASDSDQATVVVDEIQTCIDVILTIKLDNYPEETSWTIKNSSGTTVASGGTYGNQADGSTISVTNCLDLGTYTFKISDSYGDGICCYYGTGYYLLEDDAGTTLASGGSFGSSESTTFTLSRGNNSMGAVLTDLTSDENRIYPNPVGNIMNIHLVHGFVMNVTIYSTAGKMVEKSVNGNKIDVSNLKPGFYFVDVYTDKKVIHSQFIKE
ncbi:MAG: PKD domain-containing protein [Salinivirgaceae bacterium]|nr:PKD domain-containing protein [Salinivirgaceae bacterium]